METIKSLWRNVPVLRAKRIADILEISVDELRKTAIRSGVATPDDFRYRQRFVSYCLDGNHMKRCKYCSIVLQDNPTHEYHVNYGGYCLECFNKYKPRKYNKRLSWYKNMLAENWKPLNNGWRNIDTGVFLSKRYQSFFLENEITP